MYFFSNHRSTRSFHLGIRIVVGSINYSKTGLPADAWGCWAEGGAKMGVCLFFPVLNKNCHAGNAWG